MITRKLHLDKETVTENNAPASLDAGTDPWHTIECPTASCACKNTLWFCTVWCKHKTD